MARVTKAINPRLGGFRPFFGFEEEEGTASAAFGFVTYDTNDEGEQTYQMTKVELGLRSDHIVDAVQKMQGNDVPKRLVSEAGRSEGFVGSVENNAKAEQAEAKAAAA